jgi:hypothetical protein
VVFIVDTGVALGLVGTKAPPPLTTGFPCCLVPEAVGLGGTVGEAKWGYAIYESRGKNYNLIYFGCVMHVPYEWFS